MKFGIYRREPRGKWTDVEPGGVVMPTLDDAIRYYKDTYAHDDVDGTEIMFSFSAGRGKPQLVIRKVSVPRPEARLVPMHWDES